NNTAPSRVSNPTLNFGQVSVGTSSILTLFFRNKDPKGGTFLNVELFTIGVNDSHYQLINPPALPFCLGEGKSVPIQLKFTPTTSGLLSAVLTLTSSGPDEGGETFRVQLVGSGQSQSVFKTSPSSLNFGSVRVGQNAEKTLTITNTGGAPD